MTSEAEFHTLTPESLAPARLLRSLDLAPRKRLGQNFLAGTAAIRQILLALELGPADTVVEVGAGLGTLTGFLATGAGRVVAVELDDHLEAYLSGRFADIEKVQIVHGDILDLGPADLLDPSSASYKVMGNLPYYITSAALRHILEWSPPPALLVVTVQEEVARRMTASPGEMSLLALMVQLRGSVEIVARVPAGAFVPRPKVDSAVVRVVPRACPIVSLGEEEALFRLARAGFQQKRKTLLNSLGAVVPWPKPRLEAVLAGVGVSGGSRAQELSVDDWVALTRAVESAGEAEG